MKLIIEPFLQKNTMDQPSSKRLINFLTTLNLSKRELEVATLILEGKTNREIEENLFISLRTVKFHTSNIYRKTSVKSRTQFRNLSRNF